MAMFGSNFGMDMGSQFANSGAGLTQFLQGLFGNSGAPYQAASNQYQKYYNQAIDKQNPFYNAGVGAIGNFQDWLNGMKDPSGFVNSLMGKYQESPWAKYMQQQAMRAGQNAASASGLAGSTPFAQQMAQTAAGISSQDMQNWLNNVFGINTQYGEGEGTLMQGGQHAADFMGDLYGQLGNNMAEAAYGREAGNQYDRNNLLSGGMNMFEHGIFG